MPSAICIHLTFSFRPLMEQRVSTRLRQRTLFVAVFSAVFQLVFALFSFSLVDLLQVLTGLPIFLLPCGFALIYVPIMLDIQY